MTRRMGVRSEARRALLNTCGIVLTTAIILALGLSTQLVRASNGLRVSIIVPQPVYPLGSRVVVYARVTMDGAPYPGAVVLWELKDPQGVRKDFGQATTNSTGYATIAIFTSPTWPSGNYILYAAVSGTDAKANATVVLRAVHISVTVPRNYSLGSRVVVYARVTMDGAPYPGAVVLWELKDPQGVRKDFGQATTNSTGYATITIDSSRGWPPGNYSFIAVVSGTEARATATVYIKRALTSLVVYVTPSATWRGDNIRISGYVRLDPPPTTYTGRVEVYIDGTLRWTLDLSSDGTFLSPVFNTTELRSGVRRASVRLLETAESFGGVNHTTFLVDRVIVTRYWVPDPNRVNANSTQTIKFQLRYESDGSVFSSAMNNKVWINGTLARFSEDWWYINYTANLGSFAFQVTAIEDNLRTRSTRFWSEITPPSVIWDAILLANWTISDPDARVDVNSTQSLYIFAYYWYDKQPLRGKVTLNGTFSGEKWVANRGIEVNVTHARVARVAYAPTHVQDYKFGLTAFVVQYLQAPRLIWDMVIVKERRVSRERVDVESSQWMEFLLLHAYDNEAVTGENVMSSVGAATHVGGGWWRVTVTSPTSKRLEARVTSLKSQYGITAFRHEAPAAAMIFDRVVFEVSAPARVNVGTAVGDRLTVRAYYEYDRTPFEGSYEVSPSPHEIVDKVATVSYSVTRMVETKYGLTKFVSTVAVVRYDRLIVSRYVVDNNLMILEFVVNYDSDKAPALAEVRILAEGESLTTLSTARDGVCRFNFTPYLERLSRVNAVTIEPVRSLEHEVTVGVKIEVPVKLLKRILAFDPKCQKNFLVKVDPIFVDDKPARVLATIAVEALESMLVRLGSGEALQVVLKPGINRVSLMSLHIEDTDVIIPNAKAFVGFMRVYNVALEVRLAVPQFQYTGYREALLPGVISLINTGNVTLCDIHVVATLRKVDVRKEGRITVDSLQPGVEVRRSITEFRIGTAYEVGLFNLTVTAYYEPGLNIVATSATSITFVRELPADLERLDKERVAFLALLPPEWDKKFFIEEVDKQIRSYIETGAYDPTVVDDLLRRMEIAKSIMEIHDNILRSMRYLETAYAEHRACIGLQLLGNELDKAVDIWRQLRHAEAHQRMASVYTAVKLVYDRASDLARACSLVAPLPPDHGDYLASIIAEAVSLALQNRTDLALQRLDEAVRISYLMADAWSVLRIADEAIKRAEAEGRTWGLDKARGLLSEARLLFEQRRYEEAKLKALEAKEAADSAINPWFIVLPVVVLVVALVAVGIIVYRAMKIRKALRG